MSYGCGEKIYRQFTVGSNKESLAALEFRIASWVAEDLRLAPHVLARRL